jgi:Skp family chaperone for outer membrane proteins
MLRTLRVSFLVPAALIGASILPLAGCDKGGTGTGNPTPGNGGANKGAVGIIDYDRVFQDVGWKGELERSLSVTQQDYKVALESFIRDVQHAVSDKKKEIAVKGKLKPAEIAQLEKNEKLDQLPLNSDQKQELYTTLQNANYYVNQGNAYATGMLRQRRDQLISKYKEALNPAIRRVADANGITVVLIPLENVAYYNNTTNSADISAKVVDEFQKSPPPHSVPDAQKLVFPKFESISAPPAPTTAPAALPTTQPITPGRG